MAPKTWGAGETGTLEICDNYSARVTGRVDPAIGAGAANTAALAADTSCISNAANAVIAYSGGGFSDWFIPSKDELNAMCNYSRNPTTPPTGVCTGAQDGTFELDPFGFSGVADNPAGNSCCNLAKPETSPLLTVNSTVNSFPASTSAGMLEVTFTSWANAEKQVAKAESKRVAFRDCFILLDDFLGGERYNLF
jgi:hypothetical protein